RPSLCTLPITALRVTPPKARAIWLADNPSVQRFFNCSTRSSVQPMPGSIADPTRYRSIGQGVHKSCRRAASPCPQKWKRVWKLKSLVSGLKRGLAQPFRHVVERIERLVGHEEIVAIRQAGCGPTEMIVQHNRIEIDRRDRKIARAFSVWRFDGQKDAHLLVQLALVDPRPVHRHRIGARKTFVAHERQRPWPFVGMDDDDRWAGPCLDLVDQLQDL